MDSSLSVLIRSRIGVVFLARVLFTDDELDAAIIAATQNQLLALKKLEAEFDVEMRALEVDLEKIAADDRASARNNQFLSKDWITKAIAMIAVISFFGYIGVVTFVPFATPLNMEFVNLAVGWLGGVASSVMSYYFGSSSSAAQKNNLLAGMHN